MTEADYRPDVVRIRQVRHRDVSVPYTVMLSPLRTRHSVEVWCDVPAKIALQRYANRSRPAFYEDAQRMADSWPDWARRAEPLGLGRVVRVDTASEVDVDALVQRLGLAVL